MTNDRLDQILELQLAVAWAGEANTDPPRLGWWRSSMCDELGGEDLLKRLTPRTWHWAALEAARAAAKRVDDRLRQHADNPDHLVTLYRLGFETDEQLDDRLLELKQSGSAVDETFPALAELSTCWTRETLTAWIGTHGESDYAMTTTGRRLKGKLPEDLVQATRQLTAALLPFDKEYALPHFRVRR